MPPRQRRDVPRQFRQPGQAPQLFTAPRAHPHQHHFARDFRLHHQQVARPQHVSVPVASPLPPRLAGLEVETRQDPVVQPVHHPSVQHGSGEFRFHRPRGPPELAGLPASLPLPAHLEQHTPRAIAGGHQQSPRRAIDHHHLRAIDPHPVAPPQAPQRLARLRVNPLAALRGGLQHLRNSRHCGQRGRAITCRVPPSPPHPFPGHAVIGRQVPLFAAGRAGDDPVVPHQRRATYPMRDRFTLVVFQQIDTPRRLTRRRVQPGQQPRPPDGVQFPRGHSGCPPRSHAPHVRDKPGGAAVRPETGSVGQPQRGDALVTSLLLLGIGAISHDREAAPPGSHRLPPQFAGRPPAPVG